MKVARVNAHRLPILTGVGGLGGADQTPAGSLSMEDLTDVDVTGIADGDVLIWDAGTSTWIVGPFPTPGIWYPVMVDNPNIVTTDGGIIWTPLTDDEGGPVMTEITP